MAKKNYYVIKKGRKTGIFSTWSECKTHIDGFSGALYKGFEKKEDAQAYLSDSPPPILPSIKHKKPNLNLDCIFYVDGSYHDINKEFSYGVVAIFQTDEKHFCKKFNNPDLVSMRNVAGEIMGARFAMEYAIENNMKCIEIHFDYEGIEKWALGKWQANKRGTIDYQKYYNSIKNDIDVTFVKVKGHSGDKYNDLADSLAKKALGIH